MAIVLLIIAGLVAWFFLSAINRAKTRMAYADQQAAKREIRDEGGEPFLKPSWAANRDRVEEFVTGQVKLAQRSGVSIAFTSHVLRDPDTQAELMHYLTLLERRGSGFTSQQVAAGQWISERYLLLPLAEQTEFFKEDINRLGR